MPAHHTNKTELQFLSGKAGALQDLSIMVNNFTVSPSQSSKNLDNTLSFSANIKAVTCSYMFMLYNIRIVRPYLTQEVVQVLIQALVISRLD